MFITNNEKSKIIADRNKKSKLLTGNRNSNCILLNGIHCKLKRSKKKLKIISTN